jgi:hypothetical protein
MAKNRKQQKPNRPDYSAIWREDADEAEVVAAYQELVNTGDAWRMEGHVGRTAMHFIHAGLIMLGEEGRTDYYGNYVPSRNQVEPGTPGSPEYVAAAVERHQ